MPSITTTGSTAPAASWNVCLNRRYGSQTRAIAKSTAIPGCLIRKLIPPTSPESTHNVADGVSSQLASNKLNNIAAREYMSGRTVTFHPQNSGTPNGNMAAAKEDGRENVSRLQIPKISAPQAKKQTNASNR